MSSVARSECDDKVIRQRERARMRAEARRDKSTTGIIPYDYQLKLLMVGQISVGKTALLKRFVDDEFAHAFVPTIGIDFRCKYIMIDDERVRLTERFRAIVTAYYRSAVGICIVFDVTQRSTFDALKIWHASIKEHASSETALLLVANKTDCAPDERVVTTDEGKQAAKELEALYFETSAKTGDNVMEAFFALAIKCSDVLFADEDMCESDDAEHDKRKKSGLASSDPPLRLVDMNTGMDSLPSPPQKSRSCCGF